MVYELVMAMSNQEGDMDLQAPFLARFARETPSDLDPPKESGPVVGRSRPAVTKRRLSETFITKVDRETTDDR